ncbi:hypothetical protein Nepgr_023996 [Nepenthes gracilis]|uniref:Uncharacterized protein n=1 Tax=Nepenthes gracilis TaxID=150966 RepID=A0AAD3XYD3_NEPGR|nr:hypothetical protein Nepgr_023996 [Nepenthes gracilis]
MIQSSSTTSSHDSGVPLSERMGGMNKLTEETVLPSSVSMSTAQGVEELTDPTSNVQMVSVPTAQGVEEVTDPTSNVQMLDRNTGSEEAIFGGLPSLSEICNEPTIEEASNILTISGSSRSAHIQDRTQGIITAYDVPSEDVPIPSVNLDEIRTQCICRPTSRKGDLFSEAPSVQSDWSSR